MFNIEKTDFGYKLTFGDFIMAPEMTKWLEDSKKILVESPKEFGIMVDMRNLKPLPEDSQPIMGEGQKMYKESGMQRSCVILDNPTTTLQFKRIAKETGIDAFERYVDTSVTTEFQK